MPNCITSDLLKVAHYKFPYQLCKKLSGHPSIKSILSLCDEVKSFYPDITDQELILLCQANKDSLDFLLYSKTDSSYLQMANNILKNYPDLIDPDISKAIQPIFYLDIRSMISLQDANEDSPPLPRLDTESGTQIPPRLNVFEFFLLQLYQVASECVFDLSSSVSSLLHKLQFLSPTFSLNYTDNQSDKV